MTRQTKFLRAHSYLTESDETLRAQNLPACVTFFNNMSGFFKRVYELVRQVPQGKVVTYGQIAKKLGTKDSRKVGWALHSNPDGEKTPCHRVVNKNGRLAPNFGFGGGEEQRLRLEKEGVSFTKDGLVDLTKHQHLF